MIDITALASDLNDSIQMVRFYADGTEIGNRTQPPYTLAWTSTPGVYSLTAVAFDHNNDSTTSDVVTVEFTPAPSCNGVSWNGDFAYEFSDADNNPTITFISNQPGVGTPTCILYYGTDPGNMPGYGVTRNVPFQINATKGTKIYFYYTYSFPGAVEKNNADHKDTYVIGSCKTVSIRTFETMDLKYYPNPVTDILNIELPNGMNEIAVYDMTGRLIYNTTVSDNLFKYDMRECASSVYFITVINNHQKAVLKVVK